MIPKNAPTLLLAGWCALTFAHQSLAEKATVLCDDKATLVENALVRNDDLWVLPADLTRVNGFELKPEGACRGKLCIPVNRDKAAGLVMTRDGAEWFNLSKFARLMKQPVVADRPQNVWSFGVIPPLRAATPGDALAPDFALPDRQGNTVRLSDFRRKKVFLLAWASW
jgi:hypothetical protein